MLFIQPKQDRLVGLDRLDEMQRIRSSASAEIVSGPHLLIQREPEKTAELVAKFARQCIPPAKSGFYEQVTRVKGFLFLSFHSLAFLPLLLFVRVDPRRCLSTVFLFAL